MRAQRKAQRDRDKRAAAALERPRDAAPGDDTADHADDLDIDTARSLRGYDE